MCTTHPRVYSPTVNDSHSFATLFQIGPVTCLTLHYWTFASTSRNTDVGRPSFPLWSFVPLSLLILSLSQNLLLSTSIRCQAYLFLYPLSTSSPVLPQGSVIPRGHDAVLFFFTAACAIWRPHHCHHHSRLHHWLIFSFCKPFHSPCSMYCKAESYCRGAC